MPGLVGGSGRRTVPPSLSAAILQSGPTRPVIQPRSCVSGRAAVPGPHVCTEGLRLKGQLKALVLASWAACRGHAKPGRGSYIKLAKRRGSSAAQTQSSLLAWALEHLVAALHPVNQMPRDIQCPWCKPQGAGLCPTWMGYSYASCLTILRCCPGSRLGGVLVWETCSFHDLV